MDAACDLKAGNVGRSGRRALPSAIGSYQTTFADHSVNMPYIGIMT